VFVRVIYKNNVNGIVQPFLLDELIASGKITKFLRSEGWVTVGTERIRVSDYGYKGTERRKNSFRELLKWCRNDFFGQEIYKDHF
jgi:hypothetical protein